MKKPATMKVIWKRLDGKETFYAVADPTIRVQPNLLLAEIEDNLTFHREQERVNTIRARIAMAKEQSWN